MAKELLAHPEKDGVFQRGRDIRDSLSDLSIPASEVPPQAFGRKGIGMLVVPRDGEEGLEASKGRTYVHPQPIAIFNGMVQTSGRWVYGCMPHGNLGFPVAMSIYDTCAEDTKRSLLRTAGEGIRPVKCGCVIVKGAWYNKFVYLGGSPSYGLRVVGVLPSSESAPQHYYGLGGR
ncbi:MAG: hypothetical protein AB1657_04530 [Candidatus Micrarchaeota archaeon]